MNVKYIRVVWKVIVVMVWYCCLESRVIDVVFLKVRFFVGEEFKGVLGL